MKATTTCSLRCAITMLACVAIPPAARAQCDPPQVAKLLASDASGLQRLGSSVSVFRNTVFAGAPGDDIGTGAAYTFDRIDGAWTQAAKLLASDGAAIDEFGWSVSTSGDLAIVSAPGADDLGSGSGSAYIFERIAGVWKERAKLLAADGAEGDSFGRSVSISGDTAVVGAPLDDDFGPDSGSAYIFERINGDWIQVAKFVSDDGYSHEYFGTSVSISGNTAIAGAYGSRNSGALSGSASVFERTGGVWTKTAKLLASDGAADDYFGCSVSTDGGAVIVGAIKTDALGSDSGSAYIFERIGGAWMQTARLNASDGAELDIFGASVSICGEAAVVGAHGDDHRGPNSGSAYHFQRIGGVWVQAAKLVASDGVGADVFGFCVSIGGDTAVIGAPRDDVRWADTGSAYVFDLNCEPRLAVDATCPSGGAVRVSWSGATSGDRIGLIYARNTGHFTIPNGRPCAGTRLGLSSNRVQLVYAGDAGANGSRTVHSTLGPRACGGYLQLLDIAACATSNVCRVQ